MRRSTVLEALLRLCGSKLIGSAGSPQLRAPPRLMLAAAAVGAAAGAEGVVGFAAGAAVACAGAVVGAAGFGGSVGLAAGAAVPAAGAPVGAAAGGALGAQAAASTPIAPPATPNRKWRRLEGCIRISPFIDPLCS